MRLLPLAGVTAAALFAVSFAAVDAHACSCAPPPDAAVAFEGATFVFEGKAGAIAPSTPETDGSVSGLAPKTVTFTVQRSWKGGLSGSTTVTTASSSAACGRNYKMGESYLIYASKNEAGGAHDTLCSRTRPSKGADDDFTVLDGLATGAPSTDTPAQTGEPGGEAGGEAGAEGADAGEAGADGAEAGEGEGSTEAGDGVGDATADAGEAAGDPGDADTKTEGGEAAPADPPAETGGGDEADPGCSMAAAPGGAMILAPALVAARRRRAHT